MLIWLICQRGGSTLLDPQGVRVGHFPRMPQTSWGFFHRVNLIQGIVLTGVERPTTGERGVQG